MAVNANTLTAKVNKLDWIACAVFAVVALGLYIAGCEDYALIALLSSVASGLVAWLNPSKRLVGVLERKMIRKRPAR